ncbi:MAG: adenylyl-sulfate kinase [Methylophilus sp.]
MNNLFIHQSIIAVDDRHLLAGHKSFIIWFTGLSGAGKSTLAHALEKALYDMGCRTFVFDGDNVRHGLCSDLGFSQADREENIRRIGEMSKLFVEAGVIAITAFISPFRVDRNRVRALVKEGEFIEVYCNASLSICEERDTKGLYKKARIGEIKDFTGISSPYEPPEKPELEINTGSEALEKCVDQVVIYLIEHGLISVK